MVRQMESEGGVPISARSGVGTERLLRRIDEALRSTRMRCRLRVPYDRAGVLSGIYERGQVLRRDDGADAIWLDVEVPRALAGLVAPFVSEPVGSSETRSAARAAAGG
jgi:GTP-binding protein HflX